MVDDNGGEGGHREILGIEKIRHQRQRLVRVDVGLDDLSFGGKNGRLLQQVCWHQEVANA